MNYLVELENRESEELTVVVADGEAAAVYVHPDGSNRVLVVTDLDGTLIGHDEYLAKFKRHWKLHHLWRGSKLVSIRYSGVNTTQDWMACFRCRCQLVLPPFPL